MSILGILLMIVTDTIYTSNPQEQLASEDNEKYGNQMVIGAAMLFLGMFLSLTVMNG